MSTTTAGACPNCGLPVLFAGDWVLDLTPGNQWYANREITAQIRLSADAEPVALSGEQLVAAQHDGVLLFRRHNITCPRWWKGRVCRTDPRKR